MKTKALTAAQIDTLAKRLSETPIKPATSAKKAGDNLARLMAARIADDRAALVFTSIMTAESFDQAGARLSLVLDYGNPNPVSEPIPVLVGQPSAITPAVGKRQAILDQAQSGALPRAPDFSNRPPLASAPSWPRSWPWPRRATSLVCRASGLTPSRPAPMRWPTTATFASSPRPPARWCRHEDNPRFLPGRPACV